MLDLLSTTGKRHSFVGFFKFIGTYEYIQIIFVDPKSDEYKVTSWMLMLCHGLTKSFQ
jgi:hypothetical protein